MDFNQMIDYIAQLSALELSAEEKVHLSQKLQLMVQHFEKISKVNTEGVEPLVTPFESTCLLREDVAFNPLSPEQALAAAPEREGDFFKVPAVIRSDG